MTDSTILTILKVDLGISVTAYDELLKGYVALAKDQIRKEGITLQNNESDGMLVEQYAAWIHRKRKESVPMSPMLRRQLNNRLLREKAQEV